MTQPYYSSGETRLVDFLRGREIVDVAGPVVIGSATFDPSKVPDGGRALVFEAVLLTSIITVTATLVLYNVTDGATVATLTSVSLSPETKVSATLAVPGTIPNASKVYEVRLSMSSQPGGEFVTCLSATLKAKWS